ncbi:MAG: RdgB/HAM1 family non-canonical purine NTP pyrophosphatase [Oscillospiraceae bacterium]|nr:RdgB/HAM1 family non-canonical purine NTP pyrophosphatase [Oscillospiraceae bacterium]
MSADKCSIDKLLLATGNAGKIREMRELLTPLGIELVTPAELGIDLEVDENGETFEDNARLKATAFCAASGLPSVADDSGLCVDALGGAPGVHSARYAEPGGRKRKLLENMENTEQRAAKFVSSIVCAFPNGEELTATGECCGEIAREPRGDGGFGYDPVFYMAEFGKTMAEMTDDEKNAVSHRGRAMRELVQKLKEYKVN